MEKGMEKQLEASVKLDNGALTVKDALTNNKKSKKEQVSFPSFFNNDSFKKTFDDFKDMRKSIKSKMTLNAEKLLIKELAKLSDNNSELAIKIMEKSIMNSWKGVFELKDQKVGTKYEHLVEEI